LCVLMGLPMHAAVATSMFTMMFTTTAGTAYNIILGSVNLYIAIALGLGMLVGGQIGAKFACRVNAVQLKQIFGLIIILPLVSMMKLGQMWLDPNGVRGLLSTIGDVTIWLAIVLPIGFLRLYQLRKRPQSDESAEDCELPTPE
ncbi:MAG: sulfite exporter TauE/SafE family protein, partial [Candidatus Thorarchaeota archaeon]